MVTEHDLQSEILKLTFVPFLGAGASSMFPSPLDVTEEPWAPIGNRLTALFQGFPEDSPERAFLSSFIATFDLKFTPEPSPRVGESPSTPSSLSAFQTSLVQVAAVLAGEIGAQFQKLRPAVRDPDSLSVPNSHSFDSLIRSELERAIESVRALSPENGGVLPIVLNLLPKSELERKLIHLGWLLFEGGPCAADWQKAHNSIVESVRGYKPKYWLDPGSIRLSEVAWLSEVLWLSLRAPVPVYPSARDLAIAVSLRSSRLGPRTAELAVAADFSLASEMQPTVLIQEWFQFCEAPKRRTESGGRLVVAPPGVLHVSLACALHIMFREFNKRTNTDAEPLKGYPIAFTTNYDRELENAFEYLRFSYHVLFPAIAGSSAGQFQPPPAWLLKSVRFESEYRTSKTQAVKQNGVRPEVDKLSGPRVQVELLGPLVVKLHGSPLEELPSEVTPSSRRFNQHSIVLSEHDYLRNIVSEIGEGPEWSRQPVAGTIDGEKKHFWFLGYSVSDWNVRLRLYKQISQRKQGKTAETPSKTNVDRFIDPLREPLMSELEIVPDEEELSSFAATLASAPDVEKLMETMHGRGHT